MKYKLFTIALFLLEVFTAYADGPVIQTTPYTRGVLESQNAAAAQQALGFTGASNGVTLTVISNTAALALNPTIGAYATNNFTLVRTNFFNVKNFGAKANGVVRSHITISGTSLTSPDGTWTAGDVGDMIQIMAAGGKGHSFYTTISAVGSGTSITLAQAPTVNFSDQYYCVYGQNDDSSAIQSAMNACVANGGGKIYIPPGVYLIETNFVNTNQNNAQLIVPQFSSASGNTMGVSALVEIYGDHTLRTWGGDGTYGLAVPKDSTVLVGMRQGNDNTSTNFLGSSLFDCRPYNVPVLAYSSGVARWPDNDVAVQIHDLAIVTGYSPHLAAINLIGAADGSGCANVWVVGGNDVGPAFWTNSPDGTNDYGIIMPGDFQGTYGFLNYVLVNGFQNGFEPGCMQAWDCTANLCSNAIDAYLTGSGGLVAYRHGNISDCPIIYNARGNAAFSQTLQMDFAAIQATIVGENGWWTNLNQIIAIDDANGHLSEVNGWCDLYTTNTQGFPINFIGAPGVFKTYTSVFDGFNTKVVLNGENFSQNFQHNSGGGIGWDYTMSNLWVQSDLAVSGTLSVTNLFSADSGAVTVGSVLPHFVQTTDAMKFSGNGIYGDILFFGAASPTSIQTWNWQDGGGGGDSWTFMYNGVFGAALAVLGNHPLAWEAPNGQGFGAGTNGVFVGTAGFGSYGTNVLLFGATGCTNLSSANIQVIGVNGSGMWISNSTTGFKANLGNQSGIFAQSITLQPGDSLIGSSMIEVTNRAF